MNTIKIVIVDDHKIIRDGLLAILRDEATIDVVGDVSSGSALMAWLETRQVDLILLDMHMPLQSGIEVAKEVKVRFPVVKILINTMSEMPDEIEGALQAGVNGYLLKTSGSDELIKAIQMVAHGNSYFGSAVVNSFIKNMDNTISNNSLTVTELKIVKLLYEERNQDYIITELNITASTLTTHFRNMYRKLKIKTEMGLVKYALQHKFI